MPFPRLNLNLRFFYCLRMRRREDLVESLPGFGCLLDAAILPWAGLTGVAAFLVMGFLGAPLWMWSATMLVAAWGFAAPMAVLIPLFVFLGLFTVVPLRQWLISLPILKLFQKMQLMPAISPTERT